MGRLSPLYYIVDLVDLSELRAAWEEYALLDCMAVWRLYGEHLPHTFFKNGKQYKRNVFTIEYEGLIVISIGFLRREIARGLPPITFQS